MGIFWGYSDSALAHSSARIGILSRAAKGRTIAAFFMPARTPFYGWAGQGAARPAGALPVCQPVRSTRPDWHRRWWFVNRTSRAKLMSNITPLHPANAERAQSLIASIPDPSSPVDMDRLTGELPDMLGYVVALILDDFDYDANRRSKTAIAIRILATIAERFEGAQA